MMQYLENGRAADQPRAELLLGKLYYEGKWVPADAKVAEAHFQKAVGREVAADYYLGQIYRRGYLGQVYSQKALDHLLKAARNGQNSADFAIAQLFSQGKEHQAQPGQRLCVQPVGQGAEHPASHRACPNPRSTITAGTTCTSPTPATTRAGHSRRYEPRYA